MHAFETEPKQQLLEVLISESMELSIKKAFSLFGLVILYAFSGS